MDSLNLEIVTPEGKIFSNMVKSLNVPGSEGEFGIYPNHASLVTTLITGLVEIIDLNDKKDIVAINSGFIEIDQNKVLLLVDNAVYIGGDSKSELESNIKKAKNLIKSLSSNTSSYASLISKIDSLNK